MSNNTNLTLATLNHVQTNMNVGIDEVVNVFLVKYEEAQIAERTRIQGLVKEVNEKLNVVVKQAKVSGLNTVLGMLAPSFSNSLVAYKMYVNKNDEGTVDWEKKIVVFVVRTELAAHLTIGYSGSACNSVSVGVPIQADVVYEYTNLMKEKTEQLSLLSSVNEKLKSMGRKERQIKGRIAELKLEQAGMSDLLNSTDLLALVDLNK